MDGGTGGGDGSVVRAAAVRRMPEDIFRDFRARQAGLIRALTTDVERIYLLCDPDLSFANWLGTRGYEVNETSASCSSDSHKGLHS